MNTHTASGATGATKFRVLLVEEDEEMAALVTASLTQAGMQCHHTSDTRYGMGMFKDKNPHIALLSLGLPRLGGVVLCPQIRAVSSVPIAVLSVRTRKEDHIHALNLGADDFILIRPLDEQLMVSRILTLLRRVYRYDGQHANERPDTPAPAPLASATPAIESVRTQLPPGWVTCEACDYMGPSRRFERLNTRGEPAMICPHCNQAQHLTFTVS